MFGQLLGGCCPFLYAFYNEVLRKEVTLIWERRIKQKKKSKRRKSQKKGLLPGDWHLFRKDFR